MSVPFFDTKKQNESLINKLEAAIQNVVLSGHYILGENVSQFEKEFASYCGAKYAIGVASGTDALHLALRASGIKAGDEVITSPFAFVATAEAVAYCGATPVFVDIEPKTFNLSVSKIKERITPKTKAVLPVHLYGQACEMNKILEIANEYNLKVIEDCAQAAGAGFNGKKVGSFGDAGCFSFFPTKNLGCFGDGGMVTTNDEKIAEEVRVLRGHGSRTTYHHDLIGYNSRLDELQAAILRVKLTFLEGWIKLREHNAGLYQKYLKDLPEVQLPYQHPEGRHVFNQFTLHVKNRDALFAFLKTKGIGVMVYYPLPLHLQKAFASLGYKHGDFPESESAQDEVLSLPVYPELTEAEIKEVCGAIREFFNP